MLYPITTTPVTASEASRKWTTIDSDSTLAIKCRNAARSNKPLSPRSVGSIDTAERIENSGGKW